MKKAVIIGCGIAGIVCAKILADKGYRVNIIESSNKVGGLINSNYYNGYFFDHGPHMIQETRNHKLNKYIFKDFLKKCYSYKALPQDHYFENKWYNQSSFLNLQHLPRKKYIKVFQEIIKKKNYKIKKYRNEQLRCDDIMGKKLTSEVIEPLLKKYTGQELSKLPEGFIGHFNLSRFIIASPEKSQKLKENKFLDSFLAYTSYNKGLSGRKNYYPKSKGINEIFNILINDKIKKKIKIFLNQKIQHFRFYKNKIIEISTQNKIIRNFDLVIWTVKNSALKKLIKKNVKIKSEKNKVFFWSFFHFVSEKKLREKVFYSYNYEKKIPIYRITYYDNFQKKNNKKNKFRTTIEVITPKKINYDVYKKKILNGLGKMKLLKPKMKLNLVDCYSMPVIISKNNQNKNDKNFKKIKNLLSFGQGVNISSKEEIITKIYTRLSQI